jgi:hypothetical protein
MKVDMNSDEIAGMMVAIGAREHSFSHEFWEVMRELYPDVMTEVHAKVTLLDSISRLESTNARPWFTLEELEEVPNTHGKMFYTKGGSNE